MTLQQLRFLIAVAESGSINAAAQRLYTAQSNISNAVKYSKAGKAHSLDKKTNNIDQ